MTKILLIDCQLFQTSTWHRGMGKYSLELFAAISKNGFLDTYDEVHCILNSKLDLEQDRESFIRNLYEKVKLVGIDLKNRHDIHDIKKCQKVNTELLNTYVDSLDTRDVDFLMLSLFEGDLAVPVYPDIEGMKAMVFFDIIPYLFADQYLEEDGPRENYFDRFNTIFESDALFTISQTTKNDLITYMGMPPEKVHNIDGAPIELMREEVAPEKPAIPGLDRYIFFPSGNDIRKNNMRTAQAFAMFNRANGNRYKLLISSSFTDDVKRKVTALSDQIIFTDNVTEPEMKWLYENADAVLFPSLYEGLGLPVLEAISSMKPVACSDIPVFKEMSSDAFTYFDARSVDAIADAISVALNAKPDPKKYQKVADKYNWKRTGDEFVRGWNTIAKSYKRRPADAPKIAVLCPHPGGLSGIGKVIQLQHPTLSKYAEVEYYLERGNSNLPKASYLDKIATSYKVQSFGLQAYKKYDAVIYHIGNSDYHNITYWFASRYPGTVVFHDTQLEGLMNTSRQARTLSDSRVAIERSLDEQTQEHNSAYLSSVANTQLNVVLHSDYAKQAVEAVLSEAFAVQTHQINLPVPAPVENLASRNGRTIGIAGIMHATKGLDQVANLARQPEFADCTFRMFGYGFGATEEELHTLRQLPNVEIITDVSDLEFNSLLDGLDILLNYRTTYNGETSYSTLEAMRNGVVPVVRNIGWYSELDDSYAVKVDGADGIAEALKDLIDNPEKLAQISEHAVSAATKDFSFDSYASSLVEISTKNENESFGAALKTQLNAARSALDASMRATKLVQNAIKTRGKL